MPTADLISFLSLIIALSAYIAVLRLRLIDKITNEPANSEAKKKLKRISRALTLADAPLVVSGVFLFFYGFWDKTLGLWCNSPGAPDWLFSWSVGIFSFAIVVLVAHHIGAWWKSITA